MNKQLDTDIEGPGGAIGLTEMMKSFLDGCSVHQSKEEWLESEKNSVLKKTNSDVYQHHEQSDSFQNKFKKDNASLEEELRRYRNPFESKEFELTPRAGRG